MVASRHKYYSLTLSIMRKNPCAPAGRTQMFDRGIALVLPQSATDDLSPGR